MLTKKFTPFLLALAITSSTLNIFAETKPTLPKFEESNYVQYKDGDALLIYPNYNKEYFGLALFSFFTAALIGGGLAVSDRELKSILIAWGCIMGIPTGIVAAIVCNLPPASKPYLVVNKDGLWHPNFEKMLWSEIEKIVMLREHESGVVREHINLIPKDRKKFLARKNWLTQWLVNTFGEGNRRYSKLCSISEDYLPVDFDKLEDVIIAYWEAFGDHKPLDENSARANQKVSTENTFMMTP